MKNNTPSAGTEQTDHKLLQTQGVLLVALTIWQKGD